MKAETRWPRNATLVCIRDEAELLNLIRIVPELEDYAISTTPTATDVSGRHVIGTLPQDLDWLAASVTRMYYTTGGTEREPWTVEDYLSEPERPVRLVQHVAEKVETTIQQLGTEDVTFVTDRPGEVKFWKSRGVIDGDREIVIISSDPDIPTEWSRHGVFDHRTSAMVIENGIAPERWRKDVPRGATPIYTHLPAGTGESLIDGRNVAGQISPDLLHRAYSVTTWPCDKTETRFGQPVTCRYKLVRPDN